jgi:hypothetical protein
MQKYDTEETQKAFVKSDKYKAQIKAKKDAEVAKEQQAADELKETLA